ncbi:MAG: hypothetical protein ACYTGW_00570 [Planctomycetota bacterium]|jgi:hypothetical protein
MRRSKTHDCLNALRLEMPRWPLEEDAVKHHFKEVKLKRGFDKEEVAKKIVASLSKYLLDQLENPVRKQGPKGKSTTSDTIAAMVSGPVCWFTHTEVRLCVDPNGDVYSCVCEHYECDDGSDYWICDSEDL